MALQSKHTPGPWELEPGEFGEWKVRSVDDDDGWEIATVMGGAGFEGVNGRSDENARLIAAAPELFEALRRIADFDRDVTGGPEMAAIAREALTKAQPE